MSAPSLDLNPADDLTIELSLSHGFKGRVSFDRKRDDKVINAVEDKLYNVLYGEGRIKPLDELLDDEELKQLLEIANDQEKKEIEKILKRGRFIRTKDYREIRNYISFSQERGRERCQSEGARAKAKLIQQACKAKIVPNNTVNVVSVEGEQEEPQSCLGHVGSGDRNSKGNSIFPVGGFGNTDMTEMGDPARDTSSR